MAIAFTAIRHRLQERERERNRNIGKENGWNKNDDNKKRRNEC